MNKQEFSQCSMCGRTIIKKNTICETCYNQQLVYEAAGMKLSPVGIMPKSIWIAHRIEELKEAIKRFLDENYPVPHEWYEEVEDHIRGLQHGSQKERE
jgi:hypothetical protein